MINLHDAVTASYPNAGVIIGNDLDSLIVLDKEHNAMTIDHSVITLKLAELESAEQAQATAKASALAKLAALGLTQDEVKSLIG